MTAREREHRVRLEQAIDNMEKTSTCLDIFDRALADAERGGMERAAKIVERWHIKRGGYTAMAWEIREAYTARQEDPRRGE